MSYVDGRVEARVTFDEQQSHRWPAESRAICGRPHRWATGRAALSQVSGTHRNKSLTGIGIPLRKWYFQTSMRFQQARLFEGGAVMPNRARRILQYLKLVTFLAVWIALLWSVWQLLSQGN